MSQIHVDPEEFADMVMYFLLESIREELLEDNPRYKEFINHLNKKGLKTQLINHFLHMDSNTRVKYKRIKDVFDGGDAVRINIEKQKKTKTKDGVISKTIKTLKKSIGLKEEVEQEFDRELCKRIFRKVKEVRFKTSMPITEERLNKIIDYCIKEKEEEDNG